MRLAYGASKVRTTNPEVSNRAGAVGSNGDLPGSEEETYNETKRTILTSDCCMEALAVPLFQPKPHLGKR
jgi:hypothetical protein